MLIVNFAISNRNLFPGIISLQSQNITSYFTGGPHKLCDRLYFEFIEEMYGNVENPRIIILDSDKYSHLTSIENKRIFTLHVNVVLLFLRLKTAIFSDLKGSATDVHSSVIVERQGRKYPILECTSFAEPFKLLKIAVFSPQERQHTTFKVKIRLF